MRLAATIPALLALGLLAACETPREACISDASRELTRVNRFITETRANIARGYALDSRQDVQVIPDRCTGQTESGEEFTYRCDRTEVVDVDVPVPIDLRAEQAKLDSLLEQQAALQSQSQATIQACIMAHPE
jgi:hypothetical protein